MQASSSIETQTRWGADTPASAGQKGIASQRVTADVYRDALCASLQEILQPDFDALTLTTGLISETAEMAPFTPTEGRDIHFPRIQESHDRLQQVSVFTQDV